MSMTLADHIRAKAALSGIEPESLFGKGVSNATPYSDALGRPPAYYDTNTRTYTANPLPQTINMPTQTFTLPTLEDILASNLKGKEEKLMINPIDTTANNLLDSMRKSRDLAAQYSEALNDEAFQLELAAQSKRALSSYMTNEINEGVPVPADEVLDATTTVRKAGK